MTTNLGKKDRRDALTGRASLNESGARAKADAAGLSEPLKADDLIERLRKRQGDEAMLLDEAADALAHSIEIIRGYHADMFKAHADLAHWKEVAQVKNDQLVERIEESIALRAEVERLNGIIGNMQDKWHIETAALRAEIERLRGIETLYNSAELQHDTARLTKTDAQALRAEVERLKAEARCFFEEGVKKAARVAELEGALEKIATHHWCEIEIEVIARAALNGEKNNG